MEIISRSAAKSQGIKWYFTGEPCAAGHLVDRLVSNGSCRVCCNEKSRKWRADNAGAVLARDKKYREQYKVVRSSQWKKYSLENKDRLREARLVYLAENKDKVAVSKADHRIRNLVKIKEYRAKNQWRRNADERRRFSAKVNATPAWADAEKILAIYADAAKRGLHVDHIIPLVNPLVCGLHVETNLRPLSAIENQRKNNSFNPSNFDWKAK